MSSTDDVHITAPIPVGRTVLRTHAAVTAAAHDPETFSNAVSRHLQVPNGLDGEQHAAMRRLLDPFFSRDRVDALEPELVRIATDLVSDLAVGEGFDAVAALGARFAVRGQSAWLGWPASIEDELLSWVEDNRAATRSGQRAATNAVAARFDDIVRARLDERRGQPAHDVTAELMALRTEDGRPLSDAELVSILRNWTGGDLASLALCAGVVVHWLATHPQHQGHLALAGDIDLDQAIDEILRLDDPFVSNRRRATSDTEIEGCPVAAGDIVVLDWRSANRDPAVFDDGFAPREHAPENLVYGTGPHVCPGRPLATRELRVLVRALLGAGTVELAGEPVREEEPVAGFRSVPVRVVAT